MHLSDIKSDIPDKVFEVLQTEGIAELRPAQEKAINAGLLKNDSILVCTPTASGKTLIAEFAATKIILEKKQKAVYIVPLKALASEKHKSFSERYGRFLKVALSIGDTDRADTYLSQYDLIVCTAEKLDSLIRHHTPWLNEIGCVIVDEIHLLNDPKRGPTLEILLTILKRILKDVQILGLSATIGNPKELATWLDAKLVEDDWRPVPLHKGVYWNGDVEFHEPKE